MRARVSRIELLSLGAPIRLAKRMAWCINLLELSKLSSISESNFTYILHGDILYNIKRKKYRTVCAESLFANVTFDRMVMIFLWNLSFLLYMQSDYCNIQRVYEKR
jgi:hypothetical protein